MDLIPLAANDPILHIYETKTKMKVFEIVQKSGVVWASITLWRRGGSDPDFEDQSPAFILLSTPNTRQPQLAEIQRKIQALLRAERVDLMFRVQRDEITRTAHWKPLIQYRLPVGMGESIGVAGAAATGTLGGFVRLVKNDGGHQDVGITNNHVANKWIAGMAVNEVIHHKINRPSDEDDGATRRLRPDPNVYDPSVDLAALVTELETIEPPADHAGKYRKSKEMFEDGLQPLQGMATETTITDRTVLFKVMLGDSADQLFLKTKCHYANCLRRLLELMDMTNRFARAQLEAEAMAAATTLPTRAFGTTLYASGDDSQGETPLSDAHTVRDWALIEINDGIQCANTSPELRDFAVGSTVLRQTELATQAPIRSILALEALVARLNDGRATGDLLVKIGRTTGATVGRLNPSKAILPTPGNPTKPTTEWAVKAVEFLRIGERPACAFSDGGDSGSLVETVNGELVGLLWGSQHNGGFSMVTDIALVFTDIKRVTGRDVVLPLP